MSTRRIVERPGEIRSFIRVQRPGRSHWTTIGRDPLPKSESLQFGLAWPQRIADPAADTIFVAMVEVSPREGEVLVLVGQHLTNPEIASRLYISVRTVESHISSLLRKLDVPDRRALAALAGTAELTPDATPPSVLRGAPTAITTFVGRNEDAQAVVAAVAESRVVTLTGPGGIGKTRLATQASRFQSSYSRSTGPPCLLITPTTPPTHPF